MTDTPFKIIGVVGAGQMGSGIAQVCAMSGLQAVLVDVASAQIDRAKTSIKASIDKLAAKGTLTADAAQHAHGAIKFGSDLEMLSQCDLVIEAIIENEALKTEVLIKIDKLLKPGAVIASNTSSIPITRMAAATSRPDKFIGMHFMNPVPIMKLVEIIPGLATSPETTAQVTALAKALGKDTSTSQDYPGFVVNRILMPMINEAFFALMEGVASADDIDKGMKLGTNQPMGPLTLADFIGLDTCLAILKVLHEGLGDPKYRPCPLLAKYVEAGYVGRKVKRGVYKY